MRSSFVKLSVSVIIGFTVFMIVMFTLQHTQQVSHAGGGTLCVVPIGEATGPFTPCHQVFTSVQDAVDTAVSGQQIWIATGVYSDVHTRNDVSQVIYLDKSITLQGGFTIPFDAQPDPEANPTTLDAQGNGRAVYVAEGQDVTLIGLNITNGNATNLGGKANAPNGWGGGIFSISSTLTISQSTIVDNVADMQDRDGTDGGFGGGIAVRNGTLFLYNSTVRDNLAAQYDLGVGGGIAVENSEFTIENNMIVSNTAVLTDSLQVAYGFGGGIATGESNGSLINNQIGWNTAVHFGHGGNGGGFYFENVENNGEHTITMINNDIFHNVALRNLDIDTPAYSDYAHGGGVFIYNPYSFSQPPPVMTATIHNNVFRNNTASYAGTFSIGGGFFIASHSENALNLSFKENLLENNFASRSSEDGTGLGGGAVFGGATGILENNVYISNTAVISGHGMGSALYISAGSLHSVNELIKGNNIQGVAANGTIVVEEGTKTTMTNTVVIDNVDTATVMAYGGHLHMFHPTIARNQGGDAFYVSSDYQDIPSAISITNGLLVSQSVGFLVEDDNSLFVNGVMLHEVDTTVSQTLLANVTIQNAIVGDPMFAPDGYHLTADSDARFASLPTTLGFDVDREGRLFNNPSFGADEYWEYPFYLPTVFKFE